MPTSLASATLKGVGFALLGFAIFSAHDALIKALGAHYSVFQIIFFAMLFSFVPMAITMLADNAVDNFRPHNPGLLALRSVLMIAAMASAFTAFTLLPMTQAYAILFAMPLLVTALSAPLLGEVVRVRRWAAVVIGLLGVLIVLRPGVSELSLGHFAALGAACCAASGVIIVRMIGTTERPAVMILYPMLGSMVVMGMLLPFIYTPITLPHLAMMAGVGLLSVLAQFCIITAFRSAQAALIAPAQYSQILWATLYGAVFFAEQPDVYVAIGSGVVILSGVFIVWRESSENVSETQPVLRNPNPRMDAGPSVSPQLGAHPPRSKSTP